MKKVVIYVISLLLVSSHFAFPAFFAQETECKKILVDAVVDDSTDPISLKMITKNNDIYINTTDIEKISNYSFVRETEDGFAFFKLGLNYIGFQLEGTEVKLSQQNFNGKYLGAVKFEDRYYLSLSSILAWLNVTCEIDKNILHFSSPLVSYYELVEMYSKLPDSSLGEYLDDSIESEFLFLAGVNAYNNIFISPDASFVDAFMCAFKYNNDPEYFYYDAYVESYLEFGTNCSISDSIIDSVFSKFKSIRNINKLTKAVGIDLTKLEVSDGVENLMDDLGLDSSSKDVVRQFTKNISNINDLAKRAKHWDNARKAILASVSAMYIIDGYNDTLDLIIESTPSGDVANKSAKQAKKTIEKPAIAAITSIMETVTKELAGEISYFKCTELVGIITNIISPETYKGIKEYSKYTVYYDISSIAKNIAGTPINAITPKEQKNRLRGMTLSATVTKKFMELYGTWDKVSKVDKDTLEKNKKICDEFIVLASLCSTSSEGNLMDKNSKYSSKKNWEVEANNYTELFKTLLTDDSRYVEWIYKPNYLTEYLGMTVDEVAAIWGDDYSCVGNGNESDFYYQDDRLPFSGVFENSDRMLYSITINCNNPNNTYDLTKDINNKLDIRDLKEKFPQGESELCYNDTTSTTTYTFEEGSFIFEFIWNISPKQIPDLINITLTPEAIKNYKADYTTNIIEDPLYYVEYIWYKKPSELNLTGEIFPVFGNESFGINAYYENDTISLIDYEGNTLYSTDSSADIRYDTAYNTIVTNYNMIDPITFEEYPEPGQGGWSYNYYYIEKDDLIIGGTYGYSEVAENLDFCIVELAEMNQSFEGKGIWEFITPLNKYGIVVNNELVVPCEYEDFLEFDHNGIAALKKNGKWGYFNNSGKQILPCEFEEIGFYPEGRNENFAFIYNTRYPYASSYGYIAVQNNGKYGYTDIEGDTVIDFTFQRALPVYEGLAWVKTDDGWGIIILEKYKPKLSVENAKQILQAYIEKNAPEDNMPSYTVADINASFYMTDCYWFESNNNKGYYCVITLDGRIYRYNSNDLGATNPLR